MDPEETDRGRAFRIAAQIYLKTYSQTLKRRLEQEDATLCDCNIPLPKINHEYRANLEAIEYKRLFVTFTIPNIVSILPHLVCAARIPHAKPKRYGGPWERNKHDYGWFYIIISDEKTVSQAAKVLLEQGITKLVSSRTTFPGRWLNRDPYEAYKHFSSSRGELSFGRELGSYIEEKSALAPG